MGKHSFYKKEGGELVKDAFNVLKNQSGDE